MATSSIRVLVVDDFEPFRRFICSTLQDKLELPTILEASDGVEAIELAQAWRPDLILLDIGLPKLNGIEAARRIREFAPQSKILFVSQEAGLDVVQAAFSLGALGYVVKSDAGSELVTAVKAVLRGDRFVGIRFAGHGFTGPSDAQACLSVQGNRVFATLQRQHKEIAYRHEVAFYSDDASFLDHFTQFIGAALKAGNAVIVVATESHRHSLMARLPACGLDIDAAIEQGRYISLDATGMLSTFMVNDLPDPVLLSKVVDDLITVAAKAAKGEHRVAACGEGASLLWAQGKAEAAIRLERLWTELANTYDMDVLCGYPLGSSQSRVGGRSFEEIFAEHSAVHSR